MRFLNHRYDEWSPVWRQPNIFPLLLRAFQFELKRLHTRMRRLVRSRRSNETSTPDSVYVFVEPCVYFALTKVLPGQAVVEGTVTTCELEHAQDLDVVFPPSDEEIRTDNVVHPFYGHSMKSRWYDQHIELSDRKVHVRRTCANGELYEGEVAFVARQYVLDEKGVGLMYNTVNHQLQVRCVWKGVHKTPNQDNLAAWNRAVIYREDGSVRY